LQFSLNKKMKTKNMKTLTLTNSISRPSCRCGFLLLALACFALSPAPQAVDPAPDGDYPGENTAEGAFALQNLTTGIQNTADGSFTLFENATGNHNTATGYAALTNNTASNNTANGFGALGFNTTGSDNAATGYRALLSNGIGKNNTATGSQALFSNTTGAYNTANGESALYSNTTGSANTAVGRDALYYHMTGSANTAVGDEALLDHRTGDGNTAVGWEALILNTTGNGNTAMGFHALTSHTTGNNNTAVGINALSSGALIFPAGSNNIALGAAAGSSLTGGDDNIDIGNFGGPAESGTIHIGRQGTQKATFIAGIIGVPVAGATVHISGSGQLGIGPPSSVRFKDAIKPMDKASEAILALKPVTFHYKKEIDPESIPQFGLVAEEVEKVNPALVTRDDQGKIYTVRYEAVNAMLLNEFLKEHRTVQKLEAALATVSERLKAQDAKIDKVNAKVELTKPAPQTVLNNQ